jgi:hypothetical protein
MRGTRANMLPGRVSCFHVSGRRASCLTFTGPAVLPLDSRPSLSPLGWPPVDDEYSVGYKPTVTEPERPAEAPAGSPTPEEISARLEALLKRTHALKAQRGTVSAGGPLSMTWPPADGELDRYDVVDVPDDERLKAPPQAAESLDTPATLPDHSAAEPVSSAVAEFARPDWSELRLRTPHDEAPPRSPWLWLLTLLLAGATLGEGAYIWHLHTTRPAQERGLLRVDGPEGADVRVDGRPIGAAPIEHVLDAGDYAVEVVAGGTVLRSDEVNLGPGRTVVLLSPAQASTSDGRAPGATSVAGTSRAEGARTATPGSSATSAASGVAEGAGLSATLGAVAIESTPPGLPVTMEGRPRGVTPLTIGRLRPGRHDVLVGGLARRVDITAGQVTPLRVSR